MRQAAASRSNLKREILGGVQEAIRVHSMTHTARRQRRGWPGTRTSVPRCRACSVELSSGGTMAAAASPWARLGIVRWKIETWKRKEQPPIQRQYHRQLEETPLREGSCPDTPSRETEAKENVGRGTTGGWSKRRFLRNRLNKFCGSSWDRQAIRAARSFKFQQASFCFNYSACSKTAPNLRTKAATGPEERRLAVQRRLLEMYGVTAVLTESPTNSSGPGQV